MFQTYVRNLTHTGPMSFSSLSKQLCTQSSFPARVVGKVQQQARTQSASNPGPLLMHMTSWRMSRWEPLRYIACSADDVFIHLKIILYYAGSYSFPIIRTKLHTTSVVSPHGAHKSSSCLARDLLWGQDSCVDGSAAAAALLPSQVSLQPAQWGQQENHIINPGPRGLTFSWWGCYSLCHKHKPHLPTPFFIFYSCVCFCLYCPFNSISFHKFSRQLFAFSLCPSGLNSALLVLSTIYLFMKVSLSPDIILCGWLGSKHQLLTKTSIWLWYEGGTTKRKLQARVPCHWKADRNMNSCEHGYFVCEFWRSMTYSDNDGFWWNACDLNRWVRWNLLKKKQKRKEKKKALCQKIKSIFPVLVLVVLFLCACTNGNIHIKPHQFFPLKQFAQLQYIINWYETDHVQIVHIWSPFHLCLHTHTHTQTHTHT